MKAGSSIEMTEPENYEETDLRTYKWLVGKLMNLAYKTRPDIAFVVRQLSKHNVDPRKSHLQAAKRVVWYLRRTMKKGLIFGRKSNNRLLRDLPPYGLIGFIESNFAEDPKDRKSVMSYCFFLNGAVVSWCSKKQKTVSISIIEAEYIALGHIAREVI